MSVDYSSFVGAHRERQRREQELAAQTALRARTAAEAVSEKLGTVLGVRRVVLYGSLARRTFGVNSDIDLAVGGLAPGMLVEALALAESSSPYPVDITPLEATRTDVANSIAEEGIQLWPR